MPILEDKTTKVVLEEQGNWATCPLAISALQIGQLESQQVASLSLKCCFFLGRGIQDSIRAHPHQDPWLSLLLYDACCVRSEQRVPTGSISHLLSLGVYQIFFQM